jgi:SulP family sulfate permease
VFSALGVYDELAHEKHVFSSTPEAIAHAREHVRRMSPATA